MAPFDSQLSGLLEMMEQDWERYGLNESATNYMKRQAEFCNTLSKHIYQICLSSPTIYLIIILFSPPDDLGPDEKPLLFRLEAPIHKYVTPVYQILLVLQYVQGMLLLSISATHVSLLITLVSPSKCTICSIVYFVEAS